MCPAFMITHHALPVCFAARLLNTLLNCCSKRTPASGRHQAPASRAALLCHARRAPQCAAVMVVGIHHDDLQSHCVAKRSPPPPPGPRTCACALRCGTLRCAQALSTTLSATSPASASSSPLRRTRCPRRAARRTSTLSCGCVCRGVKGTNWFQACYACALMRSAKVPISCNCTHAAAGRHPVVDAGWGAGRARRAGWQRVGPRWFQRPCGGEGGGICSALDV